MTDSRVSHLERIALAAWFALIALELAWYGWLAPPAQVPAAAAMAIAAVPLALPLLLLRGRPLRALLLAALVSLAYFCHGVMEAWAAPQIRSLAIVEIVLTLVLVVATGTIGLVARRTKRSA